MVKSKPQTRGRVSQARLRPWHLPGTTHQAPDRWAGTSKPLQVHQPLSCKPEWSPRGLGLGSGFPVPRMPRPGEPPAGPALSPEAASSRHSGGHSTRATLAAGRGPAPPLASTWGLLPGHRREGAGWGLAEVAELRAGRARPGYRALLAHWHTSSCTSPPGQGTAAHMAGARALEGLSTWEHTHAPGGR